MLKAILKLSVIILIGAAAYYAFVLNAPITWQSAELSDELRAEKCVGSDGKTYYGKHPQGVSCVEQRKSK